MSTFLEKPTTQPALSVQEVHVWCAELIAESADVDEIAACLSPEEFERADRFIDEKHRTHFIVARSVLRQLLGQYLELEPGAITFIYGEHGKPSIAGAELCFNLSHSHGLALYAVARERQVGVDVEFPRAQVAHERIASRFFSIKEQAALAEQPETERCTAFYNIWTRKEAYLKARGDGISAGLDTFSVSLDAEARLLHSEEGAAEPARWKLSALQPAPGYVAALCAAGDWQLKCFAWGA